MTYDEVSGVAQKLAYRDKLRLAQLLIQLARKEEEEKNPDKRAPAKATTPNDPELIQYVAERLRKLKPTKKETVLSLPSVQAAISKARPIIAGFGERFETQPVGGHCLIISTSAA